MRVVDGLDVGVQLEFVGVSGRDGSAEFRDGLRCAVLVEDLVLFVAGFENEGYELGTVCVGYQAVELCCTDSYEDLCL